MYLHRRIASIAIAASLSLTVLLLAGCGDDDDSRAASDSSTGSQAHADTSDASGSGATTGEADEHSPDEGDAPVSSDGTTGTSGSSGTAMLRLASGDSYEFNVLCMLEPQEAAGSEILFTIVSYDDPLNLDVTQFGDDSFGGAANISVYDSETYDVVWEAASLAGTEISLSLDGGEVTGRGAFLPAGDPDADAVQGELSATC